MDKDIILGTGVFDNDELNTGAAADVTYYFNTTGTKTATSRYLQSPGCPAKAVEIIPSDDVTILSINNNTLTSPKTISTNGATITGIVNKLVVRCTAARNLKVFVKW